MSDARLLKLSINSHRFDDDEKFVNWLTQVYGFTADDREQLSDSGRLVTYVREWISVTE